MELSIVDGDIALQAEREWTSEEERHAWEQVWGPPRVP